MMIGPGGKMITLQTKNDHIVTGCVDLMYLPASLNDLFDFKRTLELLVLWKVSRLNFSVIASLADIQVIGSPFTS